MTEQHDYVRRVLDTGLDELLVGLPALAIDGPKGVGKTTLAVQRASTVLRLDSPLDRDLLDADPDRLTSSPKPVLIDEWQRYEPAWDLVRRAVDDGAGAGSFLLTGSASLAHPQAHSGAGRIVSLRLRPMALAERGLADPTVSLSELLSGSRPSITGRSDLTVRDYTDEILSSGFPAIRHAPEHLRDVQLDSYIRLVVDRDVREAGQETRQPQALRRWLLAYAAATATTATYEAIRDAATPGVGNPPSRITTDSYRSVLERIWVVEPLPAWLPTRSRITRLTAAPKHHLADPALAAAALGLGAGALLGAEEGPAGRFSDRPFLGMLFESLATLCVRVYAQPEPAAVSHFRTKGGDQEVDLIVERRDGKVLAVETKLSPVVQDADVRHLHWLSGRLGDNLLDAVVLTTGHDAYRRRDGVAVVPLALLGP